MTETSFHPYDVSESFGLCISFIHEILYCIIMDDRCDIYTKNMCTEEQVLIIFMRLQFIFFKKRGKNINDVTLHKDNYKTNKKNAVLKFQERKKCK